MTVQSSYMYDQNEEIETGDLKLTNISFPCYIFIQDRLSCRLREIGKTMAHIHNAVTKW